jgi:hypothetical protein
MWLEDSSTVLTGSIDHVLSQTLHLYDMRTFVHEQATIDRVQTCINLTVVDIFVRL